LGNTSQSGQGILTWVSDAVHTREATQGRACAHGRMAYFCIRNYPTRQ